MEDFVFEHRGRIAEQPDLLFCYQAAKDGQEPKAFLTLRLNALSGNGFTVKTAMSVLDDDLNNVNIVKQENVSCVDIEVEHNWESQGLALALLELGRKLLASDDVLRARADWLAG